MDTNTDSDTEYAMYLDSAYACAEAAKGYGAKFVAEFSKLTDAEKMYTVAVIVLDHIERNMNNRK
jgi:hypothetical protein